MNLEKYNERNEWLAANKNYMASLVAEGVRNVVLASALYRQTVCRSEIQPCI
jgi:gluconate kinase